MGTNEGCEDVSILVGVLYYKILVIRSQINFSAATFICGLRCNIILQVAILYYTIVSVHFWSPNIWLPLCGRLPGEQSYTLSLSTNRLPRAGLVSDMTMFVHRKHPLSLVHLHRQFIEKKDLGVISIIICSLFLRVRVKNHFSNQVFFICMIRPRVLVIITGGTICMRPATKEGKKMPQPKFICLFPSFAQASP